MAARRSADPDRLTFTEQAGRRQLIEATIDSIATRGYPATSLAAIAEQAGVSKAAVLYHYASKDQLSAERIVVRSRVAPAASGLGLRVTYTWSADEERLRPDLVPGDRGWLNLDHGMHEIGSGSGGPGVLMDRQFHAGEREFGFVFSSTGQSVSR
ncbi:TetR family transcriptional regulator [Streptomyces sp. NPDC050485]|uniref:TetR family transcriptional regulator n=1 Tax=Streptomyces sp. NPDC050485 TaxID=3365617 RepID=UPI0037AB9D08